MEPSPISASASDASFPVVVVSFPDTQIAHNETDMVSKDLKDQEQFNIEAGGFKQD